MHIDLRPALLIAGPAFAVGMLLTNAAPAQAIDAAQAKDFAWAATPRSTSALPGARR